MWLSVLALSCIASAEPELKIEPVGDGLRVRVIAQWPAEVAPKENAANQLTFSLVDENGKAGPPILGKQERQGNQRVFTPRYALTHGQRYRATWVLSETKSLTSNYQAPQRKPSEPPTVQRVYPSSDLLPANQMKFYIYFSKPMREGREIFERLLLLDQTGKPVVGAWRRTELWTADAKRFTLWIHPGRIKTGVNLRDDEGPVLVAGQSYSLVIGADIKDSEGNSLKKPFIKKFKAGPADHKQPLPARWKVMPPQANTRQPLQLNFGEPLDYALLLRLLEIHDDEGKPVPGEIHVGKEESSWEFHPKTPWRDDAYKIQVDDMLEDLAGNTPARVFDTDLEQAEAGKPHRTLTFQPK